MERFFMDIKEQIEEIYLPSEKSLQEINSESAENDNDIDEEQITMDNPTEIIIDNVSESPAEVDVTETQSIDDSLNQVPDQTSSTMDQKTAWIQYQAYEVVRSGRASAYYFFDLRNEIALGNYNWQSDEFIFAFLKYFPDMSVDQLRQLRSQAVPWLTDQNACNTQYQIIMQDSFEHRYAMIAHSWFERAANYSDPRTRAQFVFNACRQFFYPQEQQEVWNRLWNEAAS